MSARRGGGCLIALLVAGFATAPATGAGEWRPHMRSAIAYAEGRLGMVRFAVRDPDELWAWHGTDTVGSASVLKAMLLVAYLDHPSVRDRPLRRADRALIGPMIRRSDNDAASRVLAFVGPRRVYAVARRAKMRRFELDPLIWGLSRIDAVDQARFFLHVDDRVVPRHRPAALHLLASIVPDQRWGIGRVQLPAGWQLYFKGGWGSGTGAIDHQVALLRHGERRVAVAVLTSGSPSHEYAEETLRGVFTRLLRGLH